MVKILEKPQTHDCASVLPSGVSTNYGPTTGRSDGTVAQCDCGKWFVSTRLNQWVTQWARVRWYHFAAQDQIKAYEAGEAKASTYDKEWRPGRPSYEESTAGGVEWD